jgi:transcriptional regulator with XRE-family HTH domain
LAGLSVLPISEENVIAATKFFNPVNGVCQAYTTQLNRGKNLTQEQLAEKLNISKNAVSKWERGLNLPDVSIMQDLCKILDITLNELFRGEKIDDNKYKEIADNNLLEVLENSSFTLKEKIAFYKKKWRKEHISKFIFCFIIWCVFIIALKLQNVEAPLNGAVGGILATLFYVVLNNQMMIYVENNAFKKIEK